jgi:RNA polymerase sigma factor (sigma-70 family)
MASPPLRDLTSAHVARAAAGDAASRTFLVERFTPVLLAQARYRLQGPLLRVCEPHDLVQDVWAIALPRLPDLRDREGRWTPVLLKFLSTTLLRLVNHLLRKHISGRPQVLAAGGEGDAPSPVEALPAEVSGVITRMCRQQKIDAVQEALAGLDADERAVVVLRGIEQLPNREVARLLGVDDSLATRRWQRALVRLKELLPDSVFGELE